MTKKRGGKRSLGREQRERIDALHRAWDRGNHEHFAEATSASSVKKPVDPLTLDEELCRKVQRHRSANNSGVTYLMCRAKDFACAMQHLEQNPGILAAFGLERAVDEIARFALDDLAGPAPGCFVDGVGCADAAQYPRATEFRKVEGTALAPADLGSLRRLQLHHDDDDTVPVRWAPPHPQRVLSMDMIRPPVEAVVLAAAAVEAETSAPSSRLYEPSGFPPVLLLGAGHMAAAQALSVRLPACRVYHSPLPYSAPSLPVQQWEAVIVNIPSGHAWAVAEMIGDGFKGSFVERRRVLRSKWAGSNDRQYVHELLNVAQEHRVEGKPLVLMADKAAHHAAAGRLRASGVAELVGNKKRGVWVGYDIAPWAPHNVPSPTGRVVTTWRWR
jgi:hypothetical protein